MKRALLSTLVLTTAACSEATRLEDSSDPIDQLFAELGPLDTPGAQRVEGPSTTEPDGDYACTVTPIDEIRLYDQLLGQIALGDVLWPGAMLRGESVYEARLAPIALPRAPLTFSVSLESLGSGQHSARLESPSLSSYRNAIGQILSQELDGSVPARIVSEVEEINSEEQLAVALGASVDAPLVASVKAGFEFDDSTKRSRYLVKFFQIYYTVDVDPPALPHDFFDPAVTADDVATVTAGGPPVYVSSIGYGRQVMFTFESALSKEELSAALEFVYKGGVDVSGSVSLTHAEVLANTKTTAFILGGDAGQGAMAAIGGIDELKALIAEGGNYSRTSPGAPIAFKLSYVRDHTPVEIAYSSEYAQRECSRVTQRILVVAENVTVVSSAGDGGALELFGAVTAAVDDRYTGLFSWQTPITISEGASYPLNGVLGQAVLGVNPSPGARIGLGTTFFDNDTITNESFGSDIYDYIPYEAGWRRTWQINRGAWSGAQIRVQLTLTPVP